MMFLYALFFFYYLVNATDTIRLNTTNNLVLKGEVNSKMATDFIYELNKRTNKSDIYVFLNTNGGSVQEGMKIISEINKYGSSCIAERAYSMGFAILQNCKQRYILPHGSIMQHQISLGVMNEKGKIDNYMNYIDQIEDQMTQVQSLRVGMSSDEFKLKTMNEWWLYGESAVTQKCADKLINVECSSELTRSTYTEKKHGYTYTYSNCPLVTDEIKKKKNKDAEEIDYSFLFM
mgnify:CR=1 FL=1|tara:strand:+ start:481 stop:1179 length:699 start_codon:yes stop_codon:yes gene_type:complete